MEKYFFLIIIVFGNVIPSQAQENSYLQQEGQMKSSTCPEFLYRIVSVDQWQKSLRQGQVLLSPLDKDFIHLAKEDQVNQVAQKFWNDRDYVVLKLDTKKLVGRLVYETNPGGSTKYYHLYEGNIPLEAVVEVIK